MRTLLWALIALFGLVIFGGGTFVFWAMGRDAGEAPDPAAGAARPAPAAALPVAATAAPAPAEPPAPSLTAREIATLKAEGERQAAAGRYNEALQTYTKVLTGAGNQPAELVSTATRIARLYERQGRRQSAEEFYRQVLRADPRNPEALYAIAGYHYQLETGNRDELGLALATYRELDAAVPFYQDTAQRITALEERLAALATIEAVQSADRFEGVRGDRRDTASEE